jgi:DNA-binding beta-propeller fold protein YncE
MNRPEIRRESRRKATRVTTISLLLLMSACAMPSGVPKELRGAEPELVWPLPPEDPKIHYVKSIATPEDIGITKSFFGRIVEFFFGKAEQRLQQPYGIAADPEGRIFIADSAQRVVHVFDTAGQNYSTIRGAGGREFQFPVGVTLDRQGRLYVSDAEERSIFVLDRRGNSLITINEGLGRPAGLTFNPVNDFLYVVDVARHEVLVYDSRGQLRFSFGGRGGESGRLNFPTNVAVDGDGIVYITDALNFRVQIFRPDGTFLKSFGRSGDAVGDLPRPKGIGVDSEGHIFLVEGLYDVVNVFDREGRLLLTFGSPGAGRGEFWLATGLYVDGKDRIYVADSFNSRVQVFQYLRHER